MVIILTIHITVHIIVDTTIHFIQVHIITDLTERTNHINHIDLFITQRRKEQHIIHVQQHQLIEVVQHLHVDQQKLRVIIGVQQQEHKGRLHTIGVQHPHVVQQQIEHEVHKVEKDKLHKYTYKGTL